MKRHDPDNHDGVITHLEPDILECEVKWALESITMNKASGSDRIPVELFQILKDDAVKVLAGVFYALSARNPEELPSHSLEVIPRNPWTDPLFRGPGGPELKVLTSFQLSSL